MSTSQNGFWDGGSGDRKVWNGFWEGETGDAQVGDRTLQGGTGDMEIWNASWHGGIGVPKVGDGLWQSGLGTDAQIAGLWLGANRNAQHGPRSPKFSVVHASFSLPCAAAPAAIAVSAAGGVATTNITNPGAAKIAFKVRSSNNTEYCIKPVFGFVDAGGAAPIEVTRLAGPPKEDKLVIQYVPAGEATDAQAAVIAGVASAQTLTIPLKAE